MFDHLSADDLDLIMRVVQHLRAIRDGRLFVGVGFATFEDYCAARWAHLGLNDPAFMAWLIGEPQ